MFCANHSIPHEDCPNCLTTVAAMRPTIFAELAAAELRSGTECCSRCEYVFCEVVACCPQCGEPHPFHLASDDAPVVRSEPVADLGELTLRDFAALR